MKLLQQHSASLVLYARQWCSSPDDAVQEAFIDLAKLQDTPSDAVAWLFKTTRYKALNQTRAETRRQRHQHQAGNTREAWFIDDELDRKSESDELQVEIEKLHPIQREVIMAKIWGELSFAQISNLINMPVTSVFRVYREALQVLERNLNGIESSEAQSKRKGVPNE